MEERGEREITAADESWESSTDGVSGVFLLG